MFECLINTILLIVTALPFVFALVLTGHIHERGHCIAIIITSKHLNLEYIRKRQEKDPCYYRTKESSRSITKWFTASEIYRYLDSHKSEAHIRKWIKINAISGIIVQTTVFVITYTIFCILRVILNIFPPALNVGELIVLALALVAYIVIFCISFRCSSDYTTYKAPESFEYTEKERQRS